MSIAANQTSDFTLLQLDGVIDIGCAAELKTLLQGALDSGRGIRLSLGPIGDLDVTALQLLWAAQREARRAGLQFQISNDWRRASRSSLLGVRFDDCLMEPDSGSNSVIQVLQVEGR